MPEQKVLLMQKGQLRLQTGARTVPGKLQAVSRP